jgi:hypothetical protein
VPALRHRSIITRGLEDVDIGTVDGRWIQIIERTDGITAPPGSRGSAGAVTEKGEKSVRRQRLVVEDTEIAFPAAEIAQPPPTRAASIACWTPPENSH